MDSAEGFSEIQDSITRSGWATDKSKSETNQTTRLVNPGLICNKERKKENKFYSGTDSPLRIMVLNINHFFSLAYIIEL